MNALVGWLSRRNRRGSVAIMTAVLIFPMVAVVGLAIDFALWNQAHATIAAAANAAAMNAVKIAANSAIAGNTDYVANGVTAGQKWFAAHLGASSYAATLSATTLTVTVSEPTPITIAVEVTFNVQMQSVFGAMFGVAQYPMNGVAAATASIAPYLEVQMLLDNSASMLIGASASDMQTMMQLSPCAPSEVAQDVNTNPNPPNAAWPEYRCSVGNWAYTLTTCPVPVGPPWTISSLTPLAPGVSTPLYGPSCKGQPNITQNADGSWPYAAAPCAFACHSDGSKPAGSGNDLLGVARGTIGTANPVTLRLDVMKTAVNAMITTMQTDNESSGTLTIGISDFNNALNRDYPTEGEAGNDFAAALAAVGTAPTTAYGAETGIIPDLQVSGYSQPDTYWSSAGASLASQLTAAGNGTTPAAPRKVLIIVGDGLSDEIVNGTRTVGLYDTSVCTTFKNMGYTVYVLFTPYYPLAERDYDTKFHLPYLVEPTDNSANAANLLSCASSSDDYIAATDAPGLTAALKTFLTAAIVGATKFTK